MLVAARFDSGVEGALVLRPAMEHTKEVSGPRFGTDVLDAVSVERLEGFGASAVESLFALLLVADDSGLFGKALGFDSELGCLASTTSLASWSG